MAEPVQPAALDPPAQLGLGVAAALKLWLAGFGTYLLARELRLGFWPGMLAGVSFGLCAFNMTWVSYSVFVTISAMLPWLLLFVERLVRHGRSVDGLALAGVVAVVLTGGHPGAQVHVLSTAVLYALVRAVASSDVDGRARVQRLAVVGGALALGTLLAAAALLPAQQAAIDSAGAAARQGGGIETFIGGNLPAGVLRTVQFPEWWGRSSELILGPTNYTERTLYAGTIALLLAVMAVASGQGWRRKAPFVLLAVLGAAATVRAPGMRELLNNLPPFDRVQNHRMALSQRSQGSCCSPAATPAARR